MINEYKIQTVFLSVSFTTKIFQLLIQQFNIETLNNQFKLIKTSSTRNNLKYIVYEMKTNDFFTKLSKYLKENVYNNCNIHDKIIIYINNVKQCENLAKKLNCLFYHGQMSIESRKSTYNDISKNIKSNLIVATSALSAEINISTIKFVIHKYDKFMSLIDTDQKNERTGRNFQNVTCIHFVPSNFFKNNKQQTINRNLNTNSIQKIDRQMYLQFLLQKKCMRSILEYYFNNNNIESCTNDQNLCYLCENRQQFLNEKTMLYNTKLSKINIEKNNFIEKITRYSKVCVSCCYNARFSEIYTHTLFNCNYDSAIQFRSIKLRILNSISNQKLIKTDYACYSCFLPQSICNY